jgi:hypothetical protein
MTQRRFLPLILAFVFLFAASTNAGVIREPRTEPCDPTVTATCPLPPPCDPAVNTDCPDDGGGQTNADDTTDPDAYMLFIETMVSVWFGA